MRRVVRGLSLLLAALAMLLVGAGYAIGRNDSGPGPAASPASSEFTAELLKTLPVRPEASNTAYEREAFGDGWATAPSGCDVRDEVLAEESIDPVTRGPDGCDVTAGRWVSVYDLVETTDPGELDIDHFVPLAEAWASGASEWPPDLRQTFANDIRRPIALIAVTAASNRSKSDQDPAEWLPPNRAARCWYVGVWINMKASYRLAVDQAEHDALERVLADCPDGGAS